MQVMVQPHPHHFLIYALVSRNTNLLVVPPTCSEPFFTPHFCSLSPFSFKCPFLGG